MTQSSSRASRSRTARCVRSAASTSPPAPAACSGCSGPTARLREPRDGRPALPPRPGRVARPRGGAARALRADRGGEAPREDLLGRHAPAARSGRRARRPPARPLPRRADDRPGPAQPAGHVGDDRGPHGGRHDGAAHHPVPRRGRPPRRPDRRGRPRQRDRRGYGGRAQGPRRRRAPRGAPRGRLGRRARDLRDRRDVRRAADGRRLHGASAGAAPFRRDRRRRAAARRRRGRHRGHRAAPADARRRVHRADRPRRRGGARRHARGGGRMSSLALTVSDTLVLAGRNLKRIPRQPDLLIAYTIQPVMFVLLFVYVFGGAIRTPGFDYVDFLMPGIIVQSIAFGGFVTALGLSEDVQKGLIDRFRSLPMSRAAVLAGRTSSDVLLNCLSLAVLLAVGFIAGFNITTDGGEIALGIVLLLFFGYAFSWVFALVGL